MEIDDKELLLVGILIGALLMGRYKIKKADIVAKNQLPERKKIKIGELIYEYD